MMLERLAIFTDTWTPQVNGVARTLERLALECQRRGIEPLVITPDDPAAPASTAVDVVRWPSRAFWAYPHLRASAPSTRRAQSVLSHFQPSLVHVATPFGVGLAGRAAARRLGYPLVTSYHTHFSAYLEHYRLQGLDTITWPFLKWFHNGGQRTFAPTRIVADELQQRGLEQVMVWGRGVNTAQFSAAHRSESLREQLGCTAETCLVSYVGRLAPEKGLETALVALAPLLSAPNSTLRVVLVGDGPAEERLRALAIPNVIFTGRKEGQALSALYASSDVFLFPSTTETFGNVVLEAMASGVAVIAHDEGPTTEFANEHTALTVDVRRGDALVAAVETLMRQPLRRATLAHAARLEAERRGWPMIWDRLFNDYSDAVTDDAPARSMLQFSNSR